MFIFNLYYNHVLRVECTQNLCVPYVHSAPHDLHLTRFFSIAYFIYFFIGWKLPGELFIPPPSRTQKIQPKYTGRLLPHRVRGRTKPTHLTRLGSAPHRTEPRPSLPYKHPLPHGATGRAARNHSKSRRFHPKTPPRHEIFPLPPRTTRPAASVLSKATRRDAKKTKGNEKKLS